VKHNGCCAEVPPRQQPFAGDRAGPQAPPQRARRLPYGRRARPKVNQPAAATTTITRKIRPARRVAADCCPVSELPALVGQPRGELVAGPAAGLRRKRGEAGMVGNKPVHDAGDGAQDGPLSPACPARQP